MRRDGSKVRKMKVPAMDKVKNHQTSMEFRRPDFQANNARSEAFHSGPQTIQIVRKRRKSKLSQNFSNFLNEIFFPLNFFNTYLGDFCSKRP